MKKIFSSLCSCLQTFWESFQRFSTLFPFSPPFRTSFSLPCLYPLLLPFNASSWPIVILILGNFFIFFTVSQFSSLLSRKSDSFLHFFSPLFSSPLPTLLSPDPCSLFPFPFPFLLFELTNSTLSSLSSKISLSTAKSLKFSS